MMKLIVDRIDGDAAVCETAEGRIVRLSLDTLPTGVKAGSVLVEEADGFALDPEEEAARRAAIFALQEALFSSPDEADAFGPDA